MEFDYMDAKCPKCGHKDLNWRIEASTIVYNLYACSKCQTNFRVTTQAAPEYTPESGHKVTILPDACAKCGEKSVTYSHSRSVTMEGTLLAWDYLKCSKCGSLTQVGLYGDIIALG